MVTITRVVALALCIHSSFIRSPPVWGFLFIFNLTDLSNGTWIGNVLRSCRRITDCHLGPWKLLSIMF